MSKREPRVVGYFRWVPRGDTLRALHRGDVPAETAIERCHHNHYGELFDTTEAEWRAGIARERAGA